MGQFNKVLFAIGNAHTVPQRALDCGPVLGRLNQVYGPTHRTPSMVQACGSSIKLVTLQVLPIS